MRPGVFPQPCDDELDLGFAGRVAALNALGTPTLLHVGARIALNKPGCRSHALALAEIAGKDPHDFTQHHTLIPALRPASTHVGTPKEAEIRASHSRGFGRPLFSVSAGCLCGACLDAGGSVDKSQHVWRRIHHLPNVDWCVRHLQPLLTFSLDAFGARPMDAQSGRELNTDGPGRYVEPGSALDRYGQLLAQWLTREEPMSPIAFAEVIREGCLRHGLRFREAGRKSVISDFVRDRMPAAWLQKYWEDLWRKPKSGEFFGRIDGVVRDRHLAYPGATYALVLASLYETVEEPQTLLEVSNRRTLATIAASRCGHTARMQRAKDAFSRGAGLEEASRANGLPISDLEDWLRNLANDSTHQPSQRSPGVESVVGKAVH